MVRALITLTWLEIKIFVREPMGLFGTVGIPVLVFLLLGRFVGPRLARAALQPGGTVAAGLPVIVAVFMMLGAVGSLVTIVSIYREGGILKRLRATPLSPLVILSAQVLVKLLFTALTLALMILAGRRYYPVDADVPLVSFGRRPAVQHVGHPVDRFPGREPRAHGALRPAGGRSRPVSDAGPVGSLLPASIGCRRRWKRSRSWCRCATRCRCSTACGGASPGWRTWATWRA